MRTSCCSTMEGIEIVFHEAAIRITHCAEDPRLAHDVLATGTFNVLEAAVKTKVKRVVSASSASIYGQAEEFPTTEQPPRVRQPDDLRRDQELQRRAAAQLLRNVRTELRRAALLQRLRSAHGRLRRLHRGHDSLDGATGQRTALPDPRRRRADDGLRIRHRHRARQPDGGQLLHHRRRAEHRQRDGDEPQRARAKHSVG